ncbi:NADPH-dependent oxidoreductase [Synechococcus phage S-N03]|uniref:NADPH-dependent oxidoreductase n=1 Tax=Synechococcus phage S-N03 TaxID=2718943 RepID=A0A6G8R5V1_9CAUD|nr:NADPH-dependent oxidoreductase [Synechococcus phage S-N03]QIN96766.1 NADPH-dependent oxidoreductase [Synechococcus phage S-N03]
MNILVQYGSLRDASFSRQLAHNVADILKGMGAEVRIQDPQLPLYDESLRPDPSVQSYMDNIEWANGFVWISPELHGTVSAVMKNQIDWMQLSNGAVRPTQGKTLALFQVEGGSQSFNTVNLLRQIGRWMRLLTIPNQSSIPKVYQEFENGVLKDSSFRDRVIDVCEELVKFTELTSDKIDWLTDRYSERKESASELEARMNLKEAL